MKIITKTAELYRDGRVVSVTGLVVGSNPGVARNDGQ